ncbi:hypothetical protein MHBO_003098, partial [Bonamia ostreae]
MPKFLDRDFPPDRSSIFTKGQTPNVQISWKRLEDLVDVGTDLIASTSAEDIVQGSLGDCWLLASLTAIADNKKILDRIFNTKIVNSDGKYSLTFNIDGMDKVIQIDSYLPFLPNGLLYSARMEHEQIWVAVAEKAMAKCVGGYDRMESGDCEEALRDFTGCPTDTFDDKLDPGDYWQKLREYANSKDHLLTCGIDSSSIPNLPKVHPQILSNGLLMDHVYTILDARCHDETQTRLLKLRNPWGNLEFNGKWSDFSTAWNPSLRAFFGSKNDSNDGIFFISFEEFANFFNVVSYCDTRDGWNASRIKSKFVKNEIVDTDVLSLNIPEDSSNFLAIHQQDERVKNAKKHI